MIHKEMVSGSVFRILSNIYDIFWKNSSLFHDRGHYHIETSPPIYRANQWTGFYMVETLRQERVNE